MTLMDLAIFPLYIHDFVLNTIEMCSVLLYTSDYNSDVAYNSSSIIFYLKG